MKTRNVLLAFIAVLAFSSVAQTTPASLTYQGRIKSIQGTALEHNGVLFEFSITNPQGSCVIYRETSQALDMRNSGGVFDVPIGTGSKNFPAAAGFKLLDAFENSGSFSCEGGGTYNPVTDDKRLLRVQFYDGTGWRLISPDSEIRSVPYAAQSRVAQSAQRLGSLLPADVVSKADVPVCPAGQFLRHVAPTGTFLCEAVTVTGGNVTGNITGSAAGFTGNLSGDVSGTQSSTSVDRIKGTPVTSAGLATGKVLKYDGTNWAPADDDTGTANAITGLTGDVSSSGNPTATVTINNNAISTSKLQNGAVDSSKIADDSIVDADISAGAAIADSKLATITTAGKVSGSAITSGTIGGTTAINTSGLIQTSSGLRVYSGSNYVELKAPTLSQNTSYELPAADGGNGQVLTTDGTGKLNWTTIVSSGGTVTGVTANAPLTSSGGTAPVISLNDSGVTAGTYSKVTVSSKGLVTTGGSLTATDLPNLAGDVTSTAGLSNSKVEKIQGVSVASTTPVLGQVLMHDASKWNVQYFGFGQLRSTVTGNAQMPATCATANKTLNWSAITDTFTCVDIAIANTQVSGLGTAAAKNFGTAAGNLVELDGAGRIPASLMPTNLTATSVTATTVSGATLNGSLFFLDGTAAGWTNATIRNQAADGYSGIGLVDNAGNNKGYLAYANSGAGITPSTVTLGTMETTVPLTFSIGGNEVVRIAASTGNVGIGTSTPSEKLEVAGKIKGTELCIGADCRSTWPTGSGGGSGWVNVSLADTADFDVNCLYQFTTADGFVLSASAVMPSRIQSVFSGMDGNSTSNFIDISKSNKAIAAYHQSNWSNNSIGTNKTVTSIKKNCGNNGTVTTVSSTNSYLSVTNGTSTPSITANVGTVANTLAAGDDSRFSDARTPTGSANGDLSGTYPNPSVAKIQGFAVSATTPTAGQVMVYTGGAWTPTSFGIDDLKTSVGTSQFASANCTASQTLTWSAVTDAFTCANIAGLDGGAITTGTVELDRLPSSVKLWSDAGSGKINYNGGNVGIGSNNPTSKLEVNGVIHSSSGGIKFPDGTTQTTAYSASGATSGIVLSGAGRRYFDGSYATSCLSYLNGTGLYSYAGSIGDGVYTVDPDGAGATAPFDVWCSMSQGGWTYPPISKVIVSKNYNNTADSLSMEPESAFTNQDISLHSTTGGSTGGSWHGGCVIVDTSGISHSDVNLLWQASYLYGSAQSVAVSVSSSLVNYQNTPYNRLTPPDVTYFSTTKFVEEKTDTTTGIGHDTSAFNAEFRSVLFGKYSLKTQGRRYIYVCTASYNAGQWHAAKIKVRFK